MNPCDSVQQQAVQDRLEALYEADGRRDPAHPMHCLYSGLAQAASTDEPAVPEGREPASVITEPSDEELLATLDQAVAGFPPRHPEAEAMNAVEYPLALELRKARAVLARWGNLKGSLTSSPPADGEVAECAAELLQRQALVPVSVSERPWEREGWCDAEGRFWAEHISRSGVASWRCAAASDLGGWAVRCLPAHALPLPEVNNG